MPVGISGAARVALMVPDALEEARASAKRPREERDRPNEGEPKKTYRRVERSVTDWFLEWHEMQKKRRGWSVTQTVRAAKELAPELFEHVHEDVPREWRRSSALPRVESRGKGVLLSDAHMTVLSEIAGAVVAKVPVAAPVMREISNQQLERFGAAPIKSNQWVCSFLAQCGHSWRRHSRFVRGDALLGAADRFATERGP